MGQGPTWQGADLTQDLRPAPPFLPLTLTAGSGAPLHRTYPGPRPTPPLVLSLALFAQRGDPTFSACPQNPSRLGSGKLPCQASFFLTRKVLRFFVSFTAFTAGLGGVAGRCTFEPQATSALHFKPPHSRKAGTQSGASFTAFVRSKSGVIFANRLYQPAARLPPETDPLA